MSGPWLALGFRLSSPRGYLEWARWLAVCTISSLLALAALSALGAGQVVAAQQRVVDGRAPHEPERLPTPNLLPLVGTYLSRWDALTVERVVIAPGTARPDLHPPGVPRPPGPGEVYVSPGYRAEMPRSPVLREAVRGLRIVGTIDRAGLRHPDELRTVVGVPRASTQGSVLTSTTSFGDDQSERLVRLDGPLAFFGPVVALLVFGPLLGALALASRLLGPETGRRFALLRALGVRLSTCRLVAAVEVAPAALAGALIGTVGYAVLARSLTAIPGTGLRFWPEDATVSGWAMAAVAVTVGLLTPLGAGLSAVRRPPTPSTRPSSVQRRARWWWGLPLVTGLVVLLVALVALPDKDPTRKTLSVWSGGLMLLGAPLALHLLVQAVSEWLAARAETGGVLLGARWLGDRRGATFRLAATLSLGLLALGITAPFAATLRGDTAPGQDALVQARGYNLDVTNLRLTAGDVVALPGVRMSVPYLTMRDAAGNEGVALVASCAALATMVREVEGCRGAQPQWVNPQSGSLKGYVAGYRAPVRVPSVHLTLRRLPASEVRVRLGMAFLGAIRLPPTMATGIGVPEGHLVNTANAGAALDGLEARLAALAPTAQLGNDYQDLVDQANSTLGYLEFLRTGVLVGLTGVGIALVVASIRVAAERRRATVKLDAIGAPLRTRVRAHVLSQGLPPMLCACVAMIVTAVYWWCTARFDPRMQVAPRFLVLGSLSAVVVPVALVLASLPSTLARVSDFRSLRE